MGKKVHNAKARQNPKTIVDNSALKNVSFKIFFSKNNFPKNS